MTHTTNYNLNKFEATDRVTRDGFNDNADAIDAALAAVASGGCKIAVGTYTGNGKYDSANARSLTFDFQPKLVLLVCSGSVGEYTGGVCIAIRENSTGLCMNSNSANGNVYCFNYLRLEWSGNTLRWYADGGAQSMLNENGITYQYAAVG